MNLSKSLLALCALILLTLQACAVGVRHDPMTEVNRLTLRESQIAGLKVQITLKPGNAAARYGDRAVKAQKTLEDLLREANLAVPISTAADADVVVDANLYDESSIAGGLVTLFSLGTIPAWTNTELRLEARVWRGGKSRDYTLRESYTNYVWWPLIFASPFKPLIAQNDVQDNMLRTLVLRMKDDAVFK